MRVDLNCDMGESFGAYSIGHDEALLEQVTSANIACGFHAGDPGVMRATVRRALRHGAALGAHPGFPDLVGFGRRNLAASPVEVEDMVLYQIGALEAIARAEGAALIHVKPHGALYNMAARDPAIAAAIARAVRAAGSQLVLVGLASSRLLAAAREAGLAAASEVFADRAYCADGSLAPRSEPGSVLADPAEAAARARRMIVEGRVRSRDGVDVPVAADTICIHGDTPGAPEFARRIRRALEEAGVTVAPLSHE